MDMCNFSAFTTVTLASQASLSCSILNVNYCINWLNNWFNVVTHRGDVNSFADTACRLVW